MSDPCPPDLIEAAGALADLSASITRPLFRADPDVALKADSTPVSEADREAERAIRAEIARRFPDHGILGEEFGAENTGADYVWVLDPIDGTKSFVAGKPTFGTLIALAHKGAPLLGVIDHPALGDRWIGAAGHPTRHNGAPARSRAGTAFKDAIVSATAPDMFQGADADAFARVADAALYTIWGSDCFAYGQLSSGWVDLVVEAGLGTYDYMALAPVVNGAGGVMTDWSGAPLGLGSDGRVLAAGDAALHRAARAALAG